MLELGKICGRKSIGLCNDWDQVDTGAQALHHLDIERLQSVSSWADEVQASMHAQVNLVCSAWLLLLKHVALVLVVQEFYDWLPAVAVVHIVTESRGVNDGQADLEELLFQLGLGDLNLDGLVNLLRVTSAVVGVVLDGGRKEGVDEGRLSATRLASDLLRVNARNTNGPFRVISP